MKGQSYRPALTLGQVNHDQFSMLATIEAHGNIVEIPPYCVYKAAQTLNHDEWPFPKGTVLESSPSGFFNKESFNRYIVWLENYTRYVILCVHTSRDTMDLLIIQIIPHHITITANFPRHTSHHSRNPFTYLVYYSLTNLQSTDSPPPHAHYAKSTILLSCIYHLEQPALPSHWT